MNNLLSAFRFAALPARTNSFRAEVKAFLQSSFEPMPADIRARSWMGFNAAFSKKLAARGWVGVTLPAQYGGASLDAFSRFVLVEELLAAGAPVSAHWIADRQSGPLILKFGTEAQRQFYLPKICAAEAFFCIGMSEPNAGSDLASVGTRATRCQIDGSSGWRLNGRKIWTTNAQHCHYMIALVRSSGEPQDRQKGLSQFIVDLALPGVTVRPIRDLAGDAHFSEVFFDNVLLTDDALIGHEGSGWAQVNAELAFERSGPERVYSSIVLLEHWITCLRKTPAVSVHAATIGRFATHLATLRNMSIAVTAKLVNGDSPLVEAALVKDIGTEFEQSIPSVIEAALAMDPDALVDAELYRAVAYVSQMAPTYSLRGGTREILRGMIARGLGLR
ncbi:MULTISPECIES: acyl-CoA dehydrogenase family protein [Comamonadaceae]|uniref:Acyl-CoA dehydrogenase n=1 Tax=Hydrogenophaga laconesensis TaxID=1805971 RepID=A0ABU1VG23_9BURK|nr:MULTISPECIES: acyl-CoA dehydrogenase family protein [Comamonadaceae]ODS71237.1 MAG: acyl-CoA dehydrogenase [Acidovorax sp. SCN 68-22]OGB00232.1 MAG: acyl-CoA dehydrogenase [Burkholderiales bacterium RIFCSPHIGHO2_12_63_9]OGB60967.1 MAG: acyl-CoA dehydrogenase [Burkholderiales bacterium RIFCSPLOWO2_12_FULL_64_99]HCE29362.1 acyl-CoA dehydrogenase [Comamonadaceae bacterium]MBW8461466.1 acyl-CoA dehydrogenase family protein [Acidovorax sp.]